MEPVRESRELTPDGPTRPDRKLADRLLGRLSRVTTSGRVIPEVEGLRFVAIALVFLVHVTMYTALKSPTAYLDLPRLDRFQSNPLVQEPKEGYRGVELFFVISGFILGTPFAEQRLKGGRPVPLGAYFLRRLTRLEPPSLIALTGTLLLDAWVVAKVADKIESPRSDE